LTGVFFCDGGKGPLAGAAAAVGTLYGVLRRRVWEDGDVAVSAGWAVAAVAAGGALFSAALSGSLYVACVALSKWATVLCFFLLARRYWEDVHRRYFAVLFAGGMASQVFFYAWARAKGTAPFLWVSNNPQYTALWFTLGVLAGAGALIFPPRRGKIFFSGTLLALGTAGLFLSRSRSGMAAAATGLAGMAVRRWGLRGALAGAAVALGAAGVLPSAALGRLMKADDPLGFKRVDIWTAAVQSFARHPLRGWGPGQFQQAYEAVGAPQPGPVRFSHNTIFAHNEFLQFMTEYGLLAGTAGLALLGMIFRRFWNTRWVFPLLGTAVFCLFNFPFYAPINGLLVAGGLAGALGPWRGSTRPDGLQRRWSLPVGVAGGLLLLFNGAVLTGEVLFRWGPATVPLAPPGRMAARAAVTVSRPGTSETETRRALRDAERAATITPSDADNWHVVYVLRRRTGDIAGARRALSNALRWSPTRTPWYMDMAAEWVAAGDRDRAAAQIHEALRREPWYSDAWLSLGRLYRVRGEPARAERILSGYLTRPYPVSPAPASPYGRIVGHRDVAAFAREIRLCRQERSR
jgi:O-antigen ligase